MDERLLEMCDLETLPTDNGPEQGQVFELESTVTLDQPASVQENAEQSPRTHAFETLEEEEQPKKKQRTEEYDQTSFNNIEIHSKLHSFDSMLHQIQQMEQIDGSDPSPGTPQQHDTTTKQGN